MASESPVQLKVDTTDMRAKMQKLGKAAEDGREPLGQLFGYWATKTAMLFAKAGRGSRGGSYRGVHWKPFAPQYTRKTDGVTVPAWGGVPKIRGKKRKSTTKTLTHFGYVRESHTSKGAVRGRKRKTGRVTRSSWIMRDTHKMFQEVTRRPLFVKRRHLRIGTNLDYMPYQNRMRPFMFWNLAIDHPAARRIFGKWLDKLKIQFGMQ